MGGGRGKSSGASYGATSHVGLLASLSQDRSELRKRSERSTEASGVHGEAKRPRVECEAGAISEIVESCRQKWKEVA